jgi:plasmid stability protein
VKATVNIPDELFREVKIRAAREGIPLRRIVIRALEREMREGGGAAGKPVRRVSLPLISLPPAVRLRAMTNDEIDELPD